MAVTEPLISIALCTYNGEKYLIEQLNSLLNQTYSNIEIIIVDDNSNDGTIDILKQYASVEKIKIIYNKENIGYNKNFEKAIKLCQGEYIALSDQDDIWKLDKIEILYNNIKNNVLIYADSQIVDSDGLPYNKNLSHLKNFIKGNNIKCFLYGNTASGHNLFFNKKLKDYIFPFPENFFHDWWITYIAASIGTINYLDVCLVQYRQHGQNSLSSIHNNLVVKNTTVGKKMVLRRTNLKLSELNIFLSFRHLKNKDKKFILKLINLYECKRNKNYSFRLLLFLLININQLYSSYKKPFYKKIFICFKESIGERFKLKIWNYENRISNFSLSVKSYFLILKR